MASKRDEYEVRTVGATWSQRKVNKMIAQGWEVVDSKTMGLSGVREVTLRRPNPKYRGARR